MDEALAMRVLMDMIVYGRAVVRVDRNRGVRRIHPMSVVVTSFSSPQS